MTYSWDPKRFYVAGPMTGVADHNRKEFDRAASLLRSVGLEAVNPVEISTDIAGTWEKAKVYGNPSEFVRADFKALLECDAVLLLDGWDESRGARDEARVALRSGMHFYELTNGSLPLNQTSKVEDVIYGTTLDLNLGGTSPYEAGRFVPYEENPLRHTYETGGIKDNVGKAPMDLLPSRPLVAIARVLGFGARKYKPHNWRRGLPWGDTYASLQRHLAAWNDGEDLDPETGEPHLAHAGCQVLFLLDHTLSGVGADTDTRFIPCRVEGCVAGLHPTSDHRAAS